MAYLASGPAVAHPLTSPLSPVAPSSPQGNGKIFSLWGGYIATGPTGTFTSVQASWVIARVDCVQPASFTPWVGLDGWDGDPTDEIVGVQTTCANGHASYVALSDVFPAPTVYYDDPVTVGDRFTGSVRVTHGTHFTLTISDTTKGWTETTKASAHVQLASAEAIIEGGDIYPGITEQKFMNVRFNDKPLAASHPGRSATRGQDPPVYKPTKIVNRTDFSMVPRTPQ
jgi:hypothetical protein